MKSKMKLMPLLVSVTLISGCTVLPGSNMSTMGKDVIKQQDADFDLDKMVNVYPLTPRLIDQLRPQMCIRDRGRAINTCCDCLLITALSARPGRQYSFLCLC